MEKCILHIKVLSIILLLLNYCNGLSIRQSINEICRSLILKKQLVDCYGNSNFLHLLGENVNKVKYEILEPLRGRLITTSEEGDLDKYYLKLQHIASHIHSIQCKKKVVKKGVRRKIKKFQSTESPAEANEEESEEWDGWTVENLKLMMDYYEEMQKELFEIRKLIK